jgi:hypothetical protein
MLPGMSTSEKARENRLRRVADRQRLRLVKSSRRDPLAWDYGLWMIVDPGTNTVVAGTEVIGRPSMTLDEVEEWLTRPGSRGESSG